MRKFISIVMVVLLVLGVAACGGNSGDSDDPNLGVWRAVTGEMFGMSMEVEEFFEKGFTVELKAKGKCALNVDGSKANGTWTLDNGAFTLKGGGLDCKGRLENGKLTLEDVMGMGLTLVFEKEGGSPGSNQDSGQIREIVSKYASDAGYYIIDSITQEGETFGADDLKGFGISYYIVLNEDGTMELNTDNVIKGTWEPGVLRYMEDGEDVTNEYTRDGDYLTIDIGDGDITLVFKLSSGSPPSTGNSGAGALPDELAWWDGQWYGWYNILEAKGAFSDYDDLALDCSAFIDLSSDGTGTLYIWDDYEELGTIDIIVDFDRGGEYGVLYTLSGIMFEHEVEEYGWAVNPSREDYGYTIYVYSDIRDGGDYIRYEIYLRPWGATWDDMIDSLRPRGYDNWYVPFIADTDSMLEALQESTVTGGGNVFIHQGLPDRAYGFNSGSGSGNTGSGGSADVGNTQNGGNTGSNAGGAAGSDGTDAAINKYNLDPASEDWQAMSGDRVPETELLAYYEIISNTPAGSMTYEEAVKLIGAEPSRFRFNGTSRIFQWTTVEENSKYIWVNFRDDNGNGRWRNYSFSKTNM